MSDEIDKKQYKEVIEAMGMIGTTTPIRNKLNKVLAHTDDDKMRSLLKILLQRDIVSMNLKEENILEIFNVEDNDLEVDYIKIEHYRNIDEIYYLLSRINIKYLYFYCYSKAYKNNEDANNILIELTKLIINCEQIIDKHKAANAQ